MGFLLKSSSEGKGVVWGLWMKQYYLHGGSYMGFIIPGYFCIRLKYSTIKSKRVCVILTPQFVLEAGKGIIVFMDIKTDSV